MRSARVRKQIVNQFKITRIIPSFGHYLFCLAHLFLLLLGPVHAFTPTWSASATQCGEFIVQWTVTNSSAPTGPPFNLLIVPVNQPYSQFPDLTGLTGANLSLPLQVAIPDSAWNAASNTGSYTISALPLRSGERFIVVMDDGFGLGTGGVSDIQTISLSSGPTSCLGPIGSNANILFELSTFVPSQCQPLSITTAQASAIRGFVPGGSPFSLDLPAASAGNMTTEWNVNVGTGSSFVLVYVGKDGKLASSGLIQTTDGTTDYGTTCLINSPHTTSGLSGTATNLLPGSSAPASVGSTSGGGGGSSISVPALVGGIIGALAFLAITALIIFFCIVRRTDAMGRPKSRSTNSRGGGRSTVEPYKSFNLSTGSGIADEAGAGGSGGIARGTGGASVGRKTTGGSRSSSSPSVAAGAGAASGTLEARFGNGIFGRKKKGSNVGRGGANGGSRGDRDLTNSQRRAMYPGLSIASTQNRSIGAVSAGAGLAGEDGHLDQSGGWGGRAHNEPAVPPVGGIVTAYREAKRREARTERELVRRDSEASSLVSGNGTMSSAPIVEEDRLPAVWRRGDLSAIQEGTGYGSGTHMTQRAGQRQNRHSFEDSDIYHDGSSVAMLLADMSTNEKSTSSDPTSSSDPALGASAAMRDGGRRPSTATNSGAGPYHLPTSLVRSPAAGNVGDSGLRTHEYPPDSKDDSQPSGINWRPGSGTLAAGYHPYATAQSPHSDEYSSPFHSGSIMTAAAESNTSRGGRGAGRGGGGRHPYADPLNAPTEIIRHTDAGPMTGDSDDEDDDEAGLGGRRRVVELPPSYGEVTSSNRGRWRGGGGG